MWLQCLSAPVFNLSGTKKKECQLGSVFSYSGYRSMVNYPWFQLLGPPKKEGDSQKHLVKPPQCKIRKLTFRY